MSFRRRLKLSIFILLVGFPPQMHIILDGTVRTDEVSSSTEVGRWLTIGLQKKTEEHEIGLSSTDTKLLSGVSLDP